MIRFIIAWEAYGEWKTTMPFRTSEEALKHIEKVLCIPERDYNKHAQIIPIKINENAP